MLLVVPLTLADSNQHNLADSIDSTGFHWIPRNYGKFSWTPLESAKFGPCHALRVQQSLPDSAGMCGAV